MSISRRSFLGGAAAALAAPLAIQALNAPSAWAATAQTLSVRLNNNSGHTAYCFITGTEIASGRPMFIQSDGHTIYRPTSPNGTLQPLAADCAIPVTGATITVPRMVGGRVWFSLDQKLTFLLNPGGDANHPGIVMPSAANPSDPNVAIQWGFCELTFNDVELFGNISFVDFVGVPIAMDLSDGQHVGGMPAGGLDRVAAGMRAQHNADGAAWDRLVVNGSDGRPLRVLSPNLYGGNAFNGYFDGYVNQVWQKYSTTDLVIDTQYTWGVVHGRVQNDLLTFPGVGSFARPSAQAIFSCSNLPFTTNNDEMGNLSARLAAAFNRTSLLDSPNQPSSGSFYANARTNHYSRIVHSVEEGGLGYAFPYDDVHANGAPNIEGSVVSGNPGLLTITVGNPH